MTLSGMFTGQGGGSAGIFYTLGTARPPVVCTAVEHDPLIYLEVEEGAFADEEEPDAVGALGIKLTGVQRACARLSRDMAAARPAPADTFAAARAALAPGYEAPSLAPDALRALLGQSRMAAAHLDCADRYDVALRPSTQVAGAAYDRDARAIWYNPALPPGPLVLATAAELRRHWQDRQGALVPPLAFAPEQALLVSRAQAADLAQMAIRVAWDLRLSGDARAWAHVEGGALADLGQTFAAEAFLDFRGLNSGDAALAVFEAWFLSPRCAAGDRALIHRMLAGLSAPRARVAEGLSEAMSLAAPELLAALGRRPLGENYLARHVASILDDPLFTEVRDRANANFLWFVKFETCLRAAGEPGLARDFRAAAWADPAPDTAPEAQIVPFVPRGAGARNAPRAAQGGQVVYLHRAE